jgi:predicted AlkP superfamily phosphohydrolase/phosphomutase
MLLIIGLDGADWRILDPWLQDGSLPTLAALRARARWGGLRSTMRPESSIAWTTFATGMNAGQHGIFGFVGQRPHSYDLTLNTAAAIRQPTFWQRAAAAGKKVALLNVPMTYPPQPFAPGALVTGMLTPDTSSAMTHPPELQEALLAAVPDYVINVSPTGLSLRQFIRATTRAIEARARAMLWLLRQEQWDALVAVFTATDRLQHQTLHLLDARHPRHHADEARALLPDLLDAYRAMDAGIAALLAEVGADATVVVLSDHGFSPVSRAFYPNVWLHRQGLLHFHGSPLPRLSLRQRLARQRWLRRLRGMWPVSGPARVAASPAAWMKNIDWTRTKAVYSPASGIRLNVQGREPQGILTPPEAAALAQDLKTELLAITDPQTGAHPVTAVFTREMLYAGPFLQNAPDLILDPQRDGAHPAYNNIVPRKFAPALFADSGDKSGNHAHTGILLAAGPGIEPGPIADAHLIDLAPTLLHLMGLAVPRELEGQVLDFARAQPIRLGTSDPALSLQNEQGFSPEEEAIVAERLRSLGYL